MRLRAILALLGALVGLTVFATSAGARPAARATDPAYPTATCATLSLSTTHPLEGATMTISGTNFDADARVTLKIVQPSIVLKRVTTNSSGAFTTEVTLPDGLTGDRVFTAVGAQTTVCPVDPVQIYIQGGASQGAGGPGNPGGTSFTGVDVAGLLAIAAALIGVGALVNRRGRNAKRASSRAA